MRLLRRRAAGSARDGENRWIAVGLGNPGDRYARTRHNAGAMALEVLRERTGASFKRHKSGCFVAETTLSGGRILLARPISYMNESGRPVRELVRWYKADPAHLIVVHDEIDLPFGRLRIKVGGGTAGHNGLESLVAHLGTKEFVRVRIGVSRPKGQQDPVGWVLNEFSAAERKELPHILERAVDAVETIVAEGPEEAMNRFNTRA